MFIDFVISKYFSPVFYGLHPSLRQQGWEDVWEAGSASGCPGFKSITSARRLSFHTTGWRGIQGGTRVSVTTMVGGSPHLCFRVGGTGESPGHQQAGTGWKPAPLGVPSADSPQINTRQQLGPEDRD